MDWFSGDIGVAINKTRTERRMLLVFLHGSDEASNNSLTVWDDANVQAACRTANCVAIKLEADSQLGKQFAQLYPVMCVPCTFFVSGGQPVVVVGGALAADTLVAKISQAAQEHEKKCREPPPAAAQHSESADGSSQKEASPVLTEEQKVERAKILIAEKNAEKAKTEKEAELRREIERRKLGQAMQDEQRKRKDAEARKIADEIRKEKEEKKAERERIKRDIERDRADRAEKWQMEKSVMEAKKAKADQEKLSAKQRELAEKTAAASDSARLQFRLADGSSVVETFDAGATLADVRSFVSENIATAGPNFQLATTFPRRRFPPEDPAHTQTLRELQLAPSAVLMVLPDNGDGGGAGRRGGGAGRRGGGVVSSGGQPDGVLWMMLAPLLALFNIIRSMFASFFAPATPPPPPAPAAARKSRSAAAGNSPASRQDGNMHRLNRSADDDDDDENATWNGNSTQQM